MNKTFISVLSVLLLFSSSSCVVTYSGYPKPLTIDYSARQPFQKLYFWVNGVSMAGGYQAIREYIENHQNFQEVEWREEAPKEGLFLHVRVENRPPSVPSLIFGYLSLGTLTLIPAFSTKGGTDLFYDLYEGGELLKTYDYKIRRKGVLWIVMFPFCWVNLMTPSEWSSFQATAQQFLIDAEEHLEK